MPRFWSILGWLSSSLFPPEVFPHRYAILYAIRAVSCHHGAIIGSQEHDFLFSRCHGYAMERDLEISCLNARLVLDAARLLSEKELRLFSQDLSCISPIHGLYSKDVISRSALYCAMQSTAAHAFLVSLTFYLKAFSEVLRLQIYHQLIELPLVMLCVDS